MRSSTANFICSIALLFVAAIHISSGYPYAQCPQESVRTLAMMQPSQSIIQDPTMYLQSAPTLMEHMPQSRMFRSSYPYQFMLADDVPMQNGWAPSIPLPVAIPQPMYPYPSVMRPQITMGRFDEPLANINYQPTMSPLETVTFQAKKSQESVNLNNRMAATVATNIAPIISPTEIPNTKNVLQSQSLISSSISGQNFKDATEITKNPEATSDVKAGIAQAKSDNDSITIDGPIDDSKNDESSNTEILEGSSSSDNIQSTDASVQQISSPSIPNTMSAPAVVN